ncbi:MAG: LysR substrate-binding domain-containing protein [Sandaracinaceae bacterium]
MDQLRALRAFVRLVELETFSAAADALRVKQSTVSKWIAGLEEELGVRLIDRTTRSMRVTEAGQRFYRRASAMIHDYEGAVAEAREDAAALRGRIRLSVPVVFGQRFIAPLVTEFVTRHEGIELELLFSDRYVSLVEEGYDVAIRVGIPVDSTLRSHALGEGRRRLVASPTYLARHGTPSTPRDLERHQCLVHTERSTRAAWTFTRGKKTCHVQVGGRVAANHSVFTLHLAEAGLGIALLASWLTDGPIRSGALVPLLPDYQTPLASVRALTAPGRHTAPRVRALIDHLRAGLSVAFASETPSDDDIAVA